MLVLVGAVIVVHLGSMLTYGVSAFDAAGEAHAAMVAGRLATAFQAVAERPPSERDMTAHDLSSGSVALRWNGAPVSDSSASSEEGLRGLARSIASAVPGLRTNDLRLEYGEVEPSGDAHAILGAMRLADGSWLNFSIAAVTGIETSFRRTLISTSIMALGVSSVALLLVRTLVAPLRNLAGAADAIGRGPEVAVPESGADELRQVSRAFNTMQTRIHRLIHDRTQALAAVSHDLRTPITRLRLRAGFLADAEAQIAIDADLDEMEAMIDATLAYLRGDAEPEEPKPTDLSAMLTTLVNDAIDSGHCASFTGLRRAFIPLRSLAMKRAFANLIDNALTYGNTARVELRNTGTEIVVAVEDDGPGIRDDKIEEVFEPFRRLDASRNRSTGGVGLGLAIARQAVVREGGTIRLTNHPKGGLRAEVALPGRASNPEFDGKI